MPYIIKVVHNVTLEWPSQGPTSITKYLKCQVAGPGKQLSRDVFNKLGNVGTVLKRTIHIHQSIQRATKLGA